MRGVLLSCVSVLAAASASPGDYDSSAAETLILAADAAYCGDYTYPKGEQGGDKGGAKSIADWDCPPCKVAAARGKGGALSSVTILNNKARQTFAFVAVSDGWPEKRIVVAFRGSVLLVNGIDDLDSKLVKVDRGGMVGHGWYKSYQTLHDDMFTAVAALRKKYPSIKDIMVTGHSLGATQAIYAADDLASEYPGAEVHVYAFGTFRPGDADFAARVKATANLHTHEVAHRNDGIPQSVSVKDGYRHLDGGAWYPDGLPVARGAHQVGDGILGYVLCDGGEDPLCQDSVASGTSNLHDHDDYLGHAMWCCNGTVWKEGKNPQPAGCSFPFPPFPAAAAAGGRVAHHPQKQKH